MKWATIAIALALLMGTAWADPVERAGEAFERGVEKATPPQPIVKPAKPRRVLAYGRVQTHQEAVRQPFSTMEVLAKKTGAFEVVLSADPAVFEAGQWSAMRTLQEEWTWSIKSLDEAFLEPRPQDF